MSRPFTRVRVEVQMSAIGSPSGHEVAAVYPPTLRIGWRGADGFEGFLSSSYDSGTDLGNPCKTDCKSFDVAV